MQCLITGATGFIGGHIAERCVNEGHPVRAIVRPTSDTRLLDQWGAECRVGALDDREFIASCLDGVDWVFQCAAKVGDWGPMAEFRRVNIDCLHPLVELSCERPIKRFIYISSLGVYPLRHHRGTTEDEPPMKSGDGYWDTKIDAEHMVQEAWGRDGLPAVIIRPGYVYGPRDNHVLPRLLAKLKAGKVVYMGSGDQALGPIYIGNLVHVVWLALENDKAVGELFNVGDDRRVSKKEFIDRVAELAGYPKPAKHIPLALAKVLTHLMSGVGKLVGARKAPLLTKNRLKFMGMDLDYSIEKVKGMLGYKSLYTWEEGLKAAVDWCREQGRL